MTTSDPLLHLDNGIIAATVDPTYGCEVTALIHLPSGRSVLHRTPWATQATRLRASGRAPGATSDRAAWLQHYAGGWQTLFPNAGPARHVNGVKVGYHGEVASSPWTLHGASATHGDLSIGLTTIPAQIDRRIDLHGNQLVLRDDIRNLADCDIDFDLVYHPAFGGDLLDGGCTLDIDAATFTVYDEHDLGLLTPGSVHRWPTATGSDGVLDLSQVPDRPTRRRLFGHLSDIAEQRLTITNTTNDLAVTLAWTGEDLDHLWLWQELNQSPGFPWFRRCRLTALEPATRPASGPWVPQTLKPLEHRRYQLALSITAQAAGRSR